MGTATDGVSHWVVKFRSWLHTIADDRIQHVLDERPVSTPSFDVPGQGHERGSGQG